MSWKTEAVEALGLQPSVTNKDSAGTLRRPCPKCGGKDRYLVYQNSGYSYCTVCGYNDWWKSKPSQENIEEAQKDLKEERQKLKDQMKDVDWKVYHRTLMNDQKLQHEFIKRGFTETTMNNFGLGYVFGGPNGMGNNTFSIPVFMEGVLVDIRHKFEKLPRPGFKYKSHFSGVLPFPFNYDSFSKHTREILVLEGELKVIKFVQHGWENCIGISGKNMGKSFIYQIKGKINDMQKWVIAYDPEISAENDAMKLASDLIKHGGGDVRIAHFPLKPDDFLLQYGEDRTRLVLSQAIRFNN